MSLLCALADPNMTIPNSTTTREAKRHLRTVAPRCADQQVQRSTGHLRQSSARFLRTRAACVMSLCATSLGPDHGDAIGLDAEICSVSYTLLKPASFAGSTSMRTRYRNCARVVIYSPPQA